MEQPEFSVTEPRQTEQITLGGCLHAHISCGDNYGTRTGMWTPNNKGGQRRARAPAKHQLEDLKEQISKVFPPFILKVFQKAWQAHEILLSWK